MTALVSERPMAKRNDESARIDSDVMRKARILAGDQGVSIVEYLSEKLRPVVDREYDAFLARETKAQKPPKPGK